MIDSTEVGSFRYIQNPVGPDADGVYTGTQVDLTITNVIDEEGPRNPAYPSTQRVFHQAYILITKNMAGIGTLGDTSTVLGELELYRVGMVDAFRRNTNSRGVIDGSLLHSHYDDIYIRDNTSDTGAASSTGVFYDSPDIWVRNIDDGLTVHQDTIREQDNFINIKVWNNSGSDYNDVIVRVYRAHFAGTEFYYPDDWHPDNLIGEQTITVPGGGSATTVITWEADFIPDETWHPCLLAEIIPMEVSPEERHHVWDNRKLAQKNITIVDPTAEEPAEFEFHFGHASRKLDKVGILTIARIVDLPGMELYLDSDGAELEVVTNKKILPGRKYLKPVPGLTRPGGGIADLSKALSSYYGGLSITFPRDTEIILGGKLCGSPDTGCLGVTICRGSRFRIHTLPHIDPSLDKLVRIFRNGRMLYRLPVQELLGLYVPITNRGIITMKRYIDLANTPQDARGGFIQLIQSEPVGKVMGGIDLLIRP